MDVLNALRASDAQATEFEQISRLLEDRELRVAFQPIVRLDDQRVVGFEALSRFTDLSPMQVFSTARRVGLGPALEHLAISRAFEQLDDLFPGLRLNVNVSPEALEQPDVQALLLAHAHRHIGVEVSEHATITDCATTRAHLDVLHEAGIHILLDADDAGEESFDHIQALAPDVIKLDMSITRDLDSNPARRAVAQALTRFAHDGGATVIAEGIETEAEHDALLAMGVVLGQGFYMARPAALPGS